MGAILAAKDKPRSNDDQVMAALQGISHTVDLVVIDNPLATVDGENRKRESIRSLRDDILAQMHSRNQIDDAMFHAGRKWEEYHEGTAIGAVSAIDPTKEAVDGGRLPELVNERIVKAFKELRRADAELGFQGRTMIRYVLGKSTTDGGHSIQRYGMSLGMTTQREFDYLGRRFRECLETLAKLWGYA